MSTWEAKALEYLRAAEEEILRHTETSAGRITWRTNAEIVFAIKAELKRQKITVKVAALAIDTPYRTLQNQLAGNNKMSAEILLRLMFILPGLPL